VRSLVGVFFYRVPTMGKRKCKFKDEVKSKHSFSRNGHEEWEAECLICKPGTSVSSGSCGMREAQESC